MKKIWYYVITLGVGLVFTLVLVALFGTFTQTSDVIIYQNLSNAFFVSGAVLFGVGVVVFTGNGGAYDMLKYGFIKFIDRFRKDVVNKKYHTFYDYHEAQKAKQRSFLHLVVVGAVLIAIAVVFLLLNKKARG